MLSTQKINNILSASLNVTNSPNENKLLFEQLFAYIKKNTAIPNFLSSITNDSKKLSQVEALHEAIRNGDAKAYVYEDPNCYLYLLYLIQQEKIPFWQGMTVYNYIMALMQFTDRQPLKDASLQLLKENNQNKLEVESLVENGGLSLLAHNYIDSIISRMKTINVNIDYDEIAEFILKLPSTEWWLLKLQCIEHTLYFNIDKNPYYDQLMTILIFNIPCIYFTTHYIPGKTERVINYWTPSLSLVNFFLQKISSSPIQLCPIFGLMGTDTLNKMHGKNKHPAALYAPHVKSNLTMVHDYTPGPFTVFWHDVGHAHWGSMLTHSERNVIFNYYLPQLNALKLMVNVDEDSDSLKSISHAIEYINDLDLTSISKYSNNDTRFENYLFNRSAFESTDRYLTWKDREKLSDNSKIGDRYNDIIVFLMFKYSYSSPIPEQSLVLWKLALLDVYKSRRHNTIFSALETLAKNAVEYTPLADNIPDQDLQHLHVNRWLELVSSNLTSKAIWDTVRSTALQPSLLTFIIKGNLNFFHPYLPLTQEKRLEFKQFLERLVERHDNRIEKDYNAVVYQVGRLSYTTSPTQN